MIDYSTGYGYGTQSGMEGGGHMGGEGTVSARSVCSIFDPCSLELF